ncbi:DUF3644 domain-containing protein [Myceligenerans cantabricum]
MLSAIEIYNKPQIEYRDEVTVILVGNAWELALKALLRKSNRRVFYPKQANQPYRSLTLDDCLRRVSTDGLWPKSIDGRSVTANIQSLAEYRNRAIHLYNAPNLSAVVYLFLQQSVVNFRDLVHEALGRDLADSITWQLLPLGATAPAEAIEFMRAPEKARVATEVRDFMESLRTRLDEVEASGSDMGRVATVYDIHMRSVKTMTSSDLVVAVDPDASERVVVRTTDPSKTHPHTMTTLLKSVNRKRDGRVLNSRDFQSVCWQDRLRSQPRYAWKHPNNATWYWSGEAVNYFSNLDDGYFVAARSALSAHERVVRQTSR